MFFLYPILINPFKISQQADSRHFVKLYLLFVYLIWLRNSEHSKLTVMTYFSTHNLHNLCKQYIPSYDNTNHIQCFLYSNISTKVYMYVLYIVLKIYSAAFILKVPYEKMGALKCYQTAILNFEENNL